MTMRVIAQHNSTFANRIVHAPSNSVGLSFLSLLSLTTPSIFGIFVYRLVCAPSGCLWGCLLRLLPRGTSLACPHYQPLSQIIIGAWQIDTDRNVRVFPAMTTVRLGGMAMHLTDDTKVRMGACQGLSKLVIVVDRLKDVIYLHACMHACRSTCSAWTGTSTSARLLT